jgi:hypothetical protein
MGSQKKTLISKPYKCEYCGSSFLKESTLIAHSCEQKRRHLQKNEKHVVLGYQAFVKFYQKSVNYKGVKTYEEFCKSPYYNAFVKFGSFLNNVKPLYMEKYIDYIVTSGIKLDQWCRDEHYEKYAIELIRKEAVETALERSIKTMTAWAEEKSSVWNHYFMYASTNRIVWDIKDGKISPWLVLNCKSGKEALGNLNDEQLEMIFAVMDPAHWSLRFKRQPADVELVKEIAKQAGL